MKHGCCVDGSCAEETCVELPEGKTCGDCAHIRRCSAFGFTSGPSASSCDFFPRRFKESERKVER